VPVVSQCRGAFAAVAFQTRSGCGRQVDVLDAKPSERIDDRVRDGHPSGCDPAFAAAAHPERVCRRRNFADLSIERRQQVGRGIARRLTARESWIQTFSSYPRLPPPAFQSRVLGPIEYPTRLEGIENRIVCRSTEMHLASGTASAIIAMSAVTLYAPIHQLPIDLYGEPRSFGLGHSILSLPKLTLASGADATQPLNYLQDDAMPGARRDGRGRCRASAAGRSRPRCCRCCWIVAKGYAEPVRPYRFDRIVCGARYQGIPVELAWQSLSHGSFQGVASIRHTRYVSVADNPVTP
jgi:hypothetical protein